jgi:hypothetical protein
MSIAYPAAAALLLALAPPPQAVTLALDVSALAAMPPRQLRAMFDETESLWKEHGATLSWRYPGAAGAPVLVRDVLTVVAEPPHPSSPARLGAVLFLNGHQTAERTIGLSVETIAALTLQTPRAGRRIQEWPARAREELIGRALGRVLAHELGHYILAWRGHAATGLMRASFGGELLVDLDRRPFVLSGELRGRLRARLALLGAPGATLADAR